MWHCLCVYHIRGNKVYGLGKLVPHGRIFILRFFFSRIFSTVCVPMERVSHLGNKLSSFSGITVSTQLSVLRFTFEELSLICSYLDKVI